MERLQKTAERMLAPGKGILAADESTGTIGKRFDKIGVENTEEHRRAWRELLFSAPGIGEHISGAIMYDETIRSSGSDGRSFVSMLQEAGVLAGIKVDEGTVPQDSSPQEKVTTGLDGLPSRLAEYAAMGASFAKWRAVLSIDEERGFPTDGNIRENAEILARYAKLSQEAGLVPIVEPEVLMDGAHGSEACARATERVLSCVFEELDREGVAPGGMVLKSNMVLPGEESQELADAAAIARATKDVLLRVLPDALPGVAFLSGGQGEIEATERLNAMQEDGFPWRLSFSYGRALQQSALDAWKGEREHAKEAQRRFLHRARMNGLAAAGKYSRDLEGK